MSRDAEGAKAPISFRARIMAPGTYQAGTNAASYDVYDDAIALADFEIGCGE